MKTIIYYFSGTGNSYFIAKEISKRKKNIFIRSITNVCEVEENFDQVGFVFPLYYYGIPKIMEKFIKKIDLTKTKYVFSIITAGFPNGIGLEQVKDILRAKNKDLDLGAYIRMPNNYTISLSTEKRKLREKIIKKAQKKVDKISDLIYNYKSIKFKESYLYNLTLFAKSSYKKYSKNFKTISRDFSINENCNNCKQCISICPVDNIKIDNNKINFGDNCEKCLSCFNYCKNYAISYKGKKVSRKRYINSEISKKELIESRGK